MTELSGEDSLRLHVLLANQPQAIRIDESRLKVYGLAERGEVCVNLNPTTRPEAYVRAVRELLAGHLLGSPGGYPTYLRRWTRMGQMRDESLPELLLLGEPEAVVAAVCSPGLTDELGRRAWWAMEDAENARRMLGNPAIVQGRMGPVLAAYLVEFLSFETEAEKMAESVRLVLQPGLLDEPRCLDLWHKSTRKSAYALGFLQARPDALPDRAPARADFSEYAHWLGGLLDAGNPWAWTLFRVLSAPGQTWLKTVARVLDKTPTQDLALATLATIASYLALLRPEGVPDLDLVDLIAEAEACVNSDQAPAPLRACLAVAPGLREDLTDLRLLSGLGYGVLRPVLRDTSATGSLLRRKLGPVLEPILLRLEALRRPSRLGRP
jgi:hypothetical protein